MEEVQKVLDFQGDDLVAINALPMKTWELLSKEQVVLNNASQVSFPLERHGQGTRSITTILLFKAYIDILLAELDTANAEAFLSDEWFGWGICQISMGIGNRLGIAWRWGYAGEKVVANWKKREEIVLLQLQGQRKGCS